MRARGRACETNLQSPGSRACARALDSKEIINSIRRRARSRIFHIPDGWPAARARPPALELLCYPLTRAARDTAFTFCIKHNDIHAVCACIHNISLFLFRSFARYVEPERPPPSHVAAPPASPCSLLAGTRPFICAREARTLPPPPHQQAQKIRFQILIVSLRLRLSSSASRAGGVIVHRCARERDVRCARSLNWE